MSPKFRLFGQLFVQREYWPLLSLHAKYKKKEIYFLKLLKLKKWMWPDFFDFQPRAWYKTIFYYFYDDDAWRHWVFTQGGLKSISCFLSSLKLMDLFFVITFLAFRLSWWKTLSLMHDDRTRRKQRRWRGVNVIAV